MTKNMLTEAVAYEPAREVLSLGVLDYFRRERGLCCI